MSSFVDVSPSIRVVPVCPKRPPKQDHGTVCASPGLSECLRLSPSSPGHVTTQVGHARQVAKTVNPKASTLNPRTMYQTSALRCVREVNEAKKSPNPQNPKP